MIFFVGDEPGKDNIDKDVAFVGTKSYRRLLNWIVDMNLSTNDIILCNKQDLKTYSWGQVYVETKGLHDGGGISSDLLPQDRFVALGRNAEKRLKELGIDCFYLPHPSGRNVTANTSKSLKDKLKACRKWIMA